MNNKILIFQSKNLSYDSSNCFLKIICEELKNQAIEVEYCRIGSFEEDGEKLISYIGKSYLAVIDMNSNLSLAVHDGVGDYYLNLINAPFYHFLVDHPMHLHEKLNAQLKNYHVICLDKYHASYIKENYPHIKDVFVMPYGGFISKKMVQMTKEMAKEKTENAAHKIVEYEFKSDFKRRSMNIMFPATYMPEDYYLDLLKEHSPMHIGILWNMLDLIEASAKITIEEAYKTVLTYSQNMNNPANMEGITLIDRYIRAYLRNKAIAKLLKSKREIHVIGANWALYDGKDKKYLKVHEQVNYNILPYLIADTKVLFNTQPLFMDGPHDRVMNAVMNGAVSLTDECNYLNEHFNNGIDMVFYQRDNMEILPQIIEQLFDNEESLSDIAWKGYQKALNEHTWHMRVKHLIRHIKEQA